MRGELEPDCILKWLGSEDVSCTYGAKEEGPLPRDIVNKGRVGSMRLTHGDPGYLRMVEIQAFTDMAL